jgi:lipoprotein signal peptidase
MRESSSSAFRWSLPDHRRLAATYGWLALAAAAVDLASKALAAHHLADDRAVLLGDRFALLLVYNTGVTGGASIGPWTLPVNLAVTCLALGLITMIVVPLGRVERRAPLALGLIAGGALGNLASMVGGPPGVADFLAWRTGDYAIVFNVADIALWSGALLLLPVVRHLARAIRHERAASRRAALALPG